MANHVWRLGFASSMAAILTLSSLLVRGQPTTSTEQIVASDQVAFFCKDIYDPASDSKIPATLVWVPGRKGNIRIIGWKSEFFARFGWNPQQRCEEVTSKFQALYDKGQLKYLTTGEAQGYPIVCALEQENDSCDETRQLFTLKPHDNPNQVLRRLMDILKGKAGDILLQNSGGATLVPIPKLFQRAPITDREAPCRSRSAGSEVTPTPKDPDAPTQTDSAGPQWQVCPPSR